MPLTALEAWSIRPGLRAWVAGHNAEAKQRVEAQLAGVDRPAEGPVDLAVIAPSTVDEGAYFGGKIRRRLSLGASLWIVYPNPRSHRVHEFLGDIEDVVVRLFESGFHERGKVAVDDDYAAMGFTFDGSDDAESMW